jgi:RNA polymerase sigma-70 factor (ECF subfamily)
MSISDNLHELIRGAQKGSSEDFQSIYNRYVDRLFAYVCSHVTERVSAKDILQETFIDVWRALPRFTYRSEEEFLGFLFVIVKRKLAAHYKNEARYARVLSPLEVEPSAEDEHEYYHHLLSAVTNLTQQYQEVVRLRYWGDLSFSEIGKTLGIGEGAARIMHHRALQKLKEITPQ